MLILTEHSPECHFKSCKYNLQDHCGLNVKIEDFVMRQKCLPSDDWYITGSFVLDRIFGKTTANDIDVVAPQGGMPAQLPDEVLNSPLRIEMLWVTPEEEAAYQCYNINLPRITAHGLMHGEVGDSISRERLILVLPRRKKLEMLSICIAIKAMVKYDMRPDNKTFAIWIKSIQDPLRWKQLYRYMIEQVGRIESVNWDYLRAEHLIDWLDRAYGESTDTQRKQYLQCLRGVLVKMRLNTDIAYQLLMEWVEASMENNEQKKKQIRETITSQRFKFR